MLNPLCLSLCLHLTNPTPTHHLTAGVVAKYFLTCPNIFPSPDSVLGTECRWAEWAELRWTPCSLDPGPGAELLVWLYPIKPSKHNVLSHLYSTSAVQLRGMEPKQALAPDTAALAPVLAKSGRKHLVFIDSGY